MRREVTHEDHQQAVRVYTFAVLAIAKAIGITKEGSIMSLLLLAKFDLDDLVGTELTDDLLKALLSDKPGEVNAAQDRIIDAMNLEKKDA